MPPFDVEAVRAQFPALRRLQDGRPVVFLDGPGGTQVPDRVIDAVAGYYRTMNANSGGAFITSQATDALAAAAHAGVADLPRRRLAGRGEVRREHDHADLPRQPGDRRDPRGR